MRLSACFSFSKRQISSTHTLARCHGPARLASCLWLLSPTARGAHLAGSRHACTTDTLLSVKGSAPQTVRPLLLVSPTDRVVGRVLYSRSSSRPHSFRPPRHGALPMVHHKRLYRRKKLVRHKRLYRRRRLFQMPWRTSLASQTDILSGRLTLL